MEGYQVFEIKNNIKAKVRPVNNRILIRYSDVLNFIFIDI